MDVEGELQLKAAGALVDKGGGPPCAGAITLETGCDDCRLAYILEGLESVGAGVSQ